MRHASNILAPFLFIALVTFNANYWLSKNRPLELETVDYQWSCFDSANDMDFESVTITVTHYTIG